MSNISNPIVAQKQQLRQFKGRSPHLQLPLFSPQSTQNYPLTIELLPDALQWWSEPRYWLIHKASGLRVPGSFNEKEALHIQKVTRDWDWSVDTRDRKVACGLNLLALAEIVCQRPTPDSIQSDVEDEGKNAEAADLISGGEG